MNFSPEDMPTDKMRGHVVTGTVLASVVTLSAIGVKTFTSLP